MNIFSISLDDSKYSKQHPQEDALKHTDNSFAIADGITRDPIGNLDFSKFTMQDLAKTYPNPSPAKVAADKFVETFIEVLNNQTDNSIESVRKAFKQSNLEIEKLNKTHNPNPDYLDNDYWACVACGGVIKNNILYWGSIDDCKVKVFDKDFKIKLDSPNNHEVFEQYFHYSGHTPQGFDWNKPEWRKHVRKEFRNNLKQVIDEKLVSFGALTGEESALNFISYGTIELEKGDYVLFYSDGFEDLVNSAEFKDLIDSVRTTRNIELLKSKSLELGLSDWRKFGRERSLILITI